MADQVTLPAGTVTFWFTDVEDSTRRWAEDESGMRALIAQHDAIMDEVLAAHAGSLVKHNGDGIDAVFTSAGQAVAAAVDAQERLQAIGLPVRMAAHTGEAELRDRDYFGSAVNLTARIMDAGHGGQILVSQATAGLVSGVELVDLGEHRLKGVPEPQRIFQVGGRAFPTLRVDAEIRGNLPAALSDFVGRHDELSTVLQHVREHRLVTLLGVGGTGKTRLAIESGHLLASEFPEGCWIAELATVAAAEAVPFAIAAGLQIAEPEQGDVLERVISMVRNRRLLLILDNCEHVLDIAAESVERILQSCPSVAVLATSREPLMVAGEHLVPTPSLSLDDAEELFLSRARAEAPNLALDDRQLDAVRQVCERLDRLPLAIELAASRLRTMSPIDMLDRLDERFRLLVGGRRSRMERHQTMRGTVEWSYDLCSQVEQDVFCRLSVFVSEFDADAACAVAAGDDVDDVDVEDALARLVDRSLVQRTLTDDGRSRFRLLETMRAFGHEQLVGGGSAERVRTAHARHVASRVAELSLRSLGPDEAVVRRALRELSADALAALDWCIETNDWEPACKLPAVGIGGSPGVATALWLRLGGAVARQNAGDLLDPWMRVSLGWFTHLQAQWWDDETRRAVNAGMIEVIRSGHPIPTDHLMPSVIGNLTALTVDAETAQLAWQFVASLASTPLTVRCVHTLDVCDSLVQWGVQIDEVAQMQPDLERLAAQLGSVTFTRHCHALFGLVSEQRGDLPAAVAHARRALDPDGAPHPQDVLIACRLLRNLPAVGEPVSADDLRRPIEWMREYRYDFQGLAVLGSTAAALDQLGHQDLASRLIGGIPSGTVRAEFRHIYQSKLSPNLARAFDEQPDRSDHVDELFDEVLALADAWDRTPVRAVADG